jgi:two-component system, sensor histidine kinase
VILTSSKPGEGSCFTITFSPGDVTEVPFIETLEGVSQEAKHAVTNTPSLSGIKILLVEDSEDNQRLITRFLNAAGAEVETADNGGEGVTMAMQKPYDLVLMDIQMPILDGYEATEKLRSLGMNKPILALTAYALKEERERCLTSGCDAHLTKPINRVDLIHEISRLTTPAYTTPA